MDRDRIARLLEDAKSGEIGIEEALRILKSLHYQNLNFAKIDTHRGLRKERRVKR